MFKAEAFLERPDYLYATSVGHTGHALWGSCGISTEQFPHMESSLLHGASRSKMADGLHSWRIDRVLTHAEWAAATGSRQTRRPATQVTK